MILAPSYGFLGIAWSQNITYILNCIILCAYIRYTGCVKESWIPWDKEALNEWKSYLKITLPVALILYAEGFSWFVNFLFVGWLHDEI